MAVENKEAAEAAVKLVGLCIVGAGSILGEMFRKSNEEFAANKAIEHQNTVETVKQLIRSGARTHTVEELCYMLGCKEDSVHAIAEATNMSKADVHKAIRPWWRF